MSSVGAIMALALSTSQPGGDGRVIQDTDVTVAQAAEQKAVSGQDEIVVTAPPTPLERRRELRKMASEVIRRPRRGRPIASFFMPICPRVFGIPEDDARAIEARMRTNARELGVGARSSADCTHNISVIFMPPQAGTPDQWLDYDLPSLSHLLSYQRVWAISEEGPVRAWNVTVMRDADGRPQKQRAGRSKSDVGTANHVRLASRLTSPVTNEIVGAAVLIELASANGKTIEQLADYATVRSVVDTSGLAPDEPYAAETILTLFQNDDAPARLTSFDRALISKLYSSPRNSVRTRIFSGIAFSALEAEQASATGEE